MEAHHIMFLEFIGQNKKTFSIPVYQRNYDWKKEHCKKLFDDIIDLIKNSDDSHFLGTIVYVTGATEANFTEFIVIDGQQRITTIMILLKAISESSKDKSLVEEIYEEYLTNKRSPNKKFRLKLKTAQSDNDTYEKLIDNKKIEVSSNIKNNYDYFVELINNTNYSAKEIYNAVLKLSMVYISLDKNKENAQLIFESLNSTGLDLTPADLIRNYLLMGHSYDIQKRYYQNYWAKIENLLPNNEISNFIRDFLTLKTYEISNKGKIYDSFKRYCKNNKINYRFEVFLDELYMYSKWYNWFCYHGARNNLVREKLKVISDLKSTVVYPFLLELFYKCYGDASLSEEDLCQSLDIIITYLFRRLLCDYPTNMLNKVFNVLKRDIEKGYKKSLSYPENIALILLSKRGKAICPTDEIMNQYLLSRDSYNFKHIKYLFSTIEEITNKEVVEFEDLTIEHIMPQTLTHIWKAELGAKYEYIHEKFLHNIGNLTLSGYNSELSNKPFSEKKKKFKNSNISSNREICSYEEWRDKEIINRAEKIISLVSKTWKMPHIDEQYFDKDQPIISGQINIFDDVNVTNKQPYELSIIGEKYTVSSWKKSFLHLCEFFYEYDYNTFTSLINHNDFTGRKRTIITDIPQSSNQYEKLNNKIFICTNLDANSIFNYMKSIVEKFEGFENEVFIKIR